MIKPLLPLFTAALLLFSIQSNAQVGFNNPNPDPSAVVDIKSSDKGLLIPRMGTGLRLAMAIGTPAPAQGLLVFDTDLNRIYFWDGGQWRPVNVVAADSTGFNEIARVHTEMTIGASYGSTTPPNNGLIVEGNVGIGTNSPGTNKLEVSGTTELDGNVQVNGNLAASGTVSASDYELPTGSGNGPVPSGGIIMWSGSTTAIPIGWALCDGSNNTPDLRDRFIVGAGSSYSPGNTGGANAVALTQAETPLMDHTHGFSGSTTSNGSHSHAIEGSSANGLSWRTRNYSGSSTVDIDITSDNNSQEWRGTVYTNSTGSHSHSFSGTTTTSGSTNATAHENRPPYYALAFIMKL